MDNPILQIRLARAACLQENSGVTPGFLTMPASLPRLA